MIHTQALTFSGSGITQETQTTDEATLRFRWDYIPGPQDARITRRVRMRVLRILGDYYLSYWICWLRYSQNEPDICRHIPERPNYPRWHRTGISDSRHRLRVWVLCAYRGTSSTSFQKQPGSLSQMIWLGHLSHNYHRYSGSQALAYRHRRVIASPPGLCRGG